jgi:hypothetical protein
MEKTHEARNASTLRREPTPAGRAKPTYESDVRTQLEVRHQGIGCKA